MKVFVSHPGLQHAHQLAWGLHQRGLLQAFWSGIPVACEGEPVPFWLPSSLAQRMRTVGIPMGLRYHPVLFQVMIRTGAFLGTAATRDFYMSHQIFELFDWWVSRHISRLKPEVVVAFEDSAYHTMRAARAIGARCILDAPSLHHSAVARAMNASAITPRLAQINRRKDEEVALADLVLTCSPLAAESYLEAGVPAAKVQSMLLGATLPENITHWLPHTAPLRFIFAGSLRYLKSIDLILAVFGRLNIEGKSYELTFVGGEGEAGWKRKIESTPYAKFIPGMPQTELFQKLAQADCLLLPSRFDSFGMVVAESMACGTPAIVSNQTGAKVMIERFPGSGWIVDCTVESLYQCVKARIQQPESLLAARKKAVEASGHFTWEAYRDRVGKHIENWIADG